MKLRCRTWQRYTCCRCKYLVFISRLLKTIQIDALRLVFSENISFKKSGLLLCSALLFDYLLFQVQFKNCWEPHMVVNTLS